MKTNICERAVDVLIKKNAIKSDDKDIYMYGLKQTSLSLLNILTSIIIGVLFSMVWETLLFMLVYIPLRSYAGGYHAKTKLRCYLFSVMLIVLSLIIIDKSILNNIFFIILSVVSILAIILLSPTQDENKPLDLLEKIVYKKRTLILLGIWSLVAIILLIADLPIFTVSILVAFIMLSIILVIGRIKNYNL